MGSPVTYRMQFSHMASDTSHGCRGAVAGAGRPVAGGAVREAVFGLVVELDRERDQRLGQQGRQGQGTVVPLGWLAAAGSLGWPGRWRGRVLDGRVA